MSELDLTAPSVGSTAKSNPTAPARAVPRLSVLPTRRQTAKHRRRAEEAVTREAAVCSWAMAAEIDDACCPNVSSRRMTCSLRSN